MTSTPRLIGKRYQILAEIGSGGMGIVYRALDRLTGALVALKRVTVPEQDLIFSSRLSTAAGSDIRLGLAQEFKMLASLRHPNIISVLDYGFDEDRQPYFTMELLENAHNIRQAGYNQPLEKQLDLLIQMLQALTYLHRRGMLHRDLKPDNVLVVDDQVRVLDFGLAATRDYSQPDNGVIAGTLAYMSPELLQGTPASEASDLYAAGLIAYEVFAGRHPFNVGDIVSLMGDILHTPPDLVPMEAPVAIIQVVQRLLDKNPEQRYRQAQSVIQALDKATGHHETTETAAIRESFLQAAKFVGRENEIQHLTNLLNQAVHNQGSAWLLGGESGVGKSRLVEEVQTLARVRGMLVLNGQSTIEGGALYALWRPALKLLVLSTPLEPDEAAILKVLVPDISTLLGYEVPDAPQAVSAEQAQERLLAMIITVFKRQKQPILLVLEDIHWALESLDVLAQLTTQVSELPLLIIATYRDDERADLPTRLPQMQTMKLPRLSLHEIAELSEAMIGSSGKQAAVVDLLHRETEGNAFFIVEVVRALAEDAGDLEHVGIMTLPEQIFAGGIERIVQRRLLFIPPDVRPILEIAAITGRWLDTGVLQFLFGDKLHHALARCADGAVLEVSDGSWRFVHDKLRDGVLREIPAEKRPALHRQIAEAMETIYAGQSEHIFMLVYHWKAAGDAAKTLYYSEMAGDQAALVGSNAQASHYYEQALEALTSPVDTPDNQRRSVLLTLKLARAATVTLAGDTLPRLQKALTIAQGLQDEGLIARVLGSIGAFYYITGQIAQSALYLGQSMALAEKLGEEQLLILPYNIIPRVMYIAGDLDGAYALIRQGLALLEKYPDPELLCGSLGYCAAYLLAYGRMTEAETYVQKSIELATTLGQSRLSSTLSVMGSSYAGVGNVAKGLPMLEQARQIAGEIKDFATIYLSLGFMGSMFLQINDLDRAAQCLDAALQIAKQGNIILYQPVFQVYRLVVDLKRGQWQPEMLAQVDAMLELTVQTRQELSRMGILREMGYIYSVLPEDAGRDLAKAEACILQALEINRATHRNVMIAQDSLMLGQHYLRHQQLDRAKATLVETVDLCTRYELTWYLETAKGLLAGLT